MYHCDQCGWDGDTPTLREWIGEGCGGVVWTLRVCPACGEEVYETAVIREPTIDPERRPVSACAAGQQAGSRPTWGCR